jgi:carboxyl-terminal processing protease
MRVKSLRRLLPALALLAAGAAPAPARAELGCEMVWQLAQSYVRFHIRERRLTEDIEQRTIDNYLRRIDPSASLFLASELDAQRASLRGIFSRIQQGDCTALAALQLRAVESHRQALEFVRAFVGADGYAVDSSVELVLDPDKRGPPRTVEERDALLRKFVHFQIANYLASDTPLAEAKRRLIHRYELRHERAGQLRPDEIFSEFLDAYATALDPHSNYLSPDVLEDFQIHMTLSLEGIGVALAERDGYAVAERIIPGGAADRHAFLCPKDKIIGVAPQGDGEYVDVIDMPLRDVVDLIRGRKGTRVGLNVLREGRKAARFSVTIERDTIDLAEQAAKLRFEEREVGGRKLKLAVLDLPSFYGDADPSKRQSTQDVAELLRQVREAKADGLLLDLSRNGGGLLEHAVLISGYFLRRGAIVGIQDALGRQQELDDEDDGVLYAGPLVVHTSRLSASASEILAGALKDYHRAVITGDGHTFGKGTVQTVSTLDAGQGALKITTAMFFRPGGRSTQNDGVESDVLIPSRWMSDEIGEKSQRYSLPGVSVAPFLGSVANGAAPAPSHWRALGGSELATLSEHSLARQAGNEAFSKMQEDLRHERESAGVVKLADILKEKPEDGEQTAAAEEPAQEESAEGCGGAQPEEEEHPPQLDEALSVLADWVLLQS